ncbi:MAG: hypothetical protein EAX90_13045 [Candidatus Heimdallarchaeota archaeon]|nr:hypothetical protein [Candidatus Heimdallarchaeota archaeon]
MLKKTNQISIFYNQIVNQIENRDIIVRKITSKFNTVKSLATDDKIKTNQGFTLVLTHRAELDSQVIIPIDNIIENSQSKLNSTENEDPP